MQANRVRAASISSACCKRVRVSHLECVCPVVTAKLAALIDINRVIKLLKGCGRRVPRHFKCGCKTNSSLSLSLISVYIYI
ncbi:hypothetical protein Patl1_17699 [Pistacia atlantica]|uniref:Uncharacterized protein n=1 Tax=Pistacia atlantica TaxID=434234 RepID=A0ACC1C3I2_9ROSI|nr:hypothetical protein Patl1_17699 [Pistacia atlantica]